MLFNRSLFLGIDPSSGKRAISYAAIDNDLCLVALGCGNLDEVLAFVSGQQQAVVAVNAPPRPNLGLMGDGDVRARLSPPPKPGHHIDCRVGEYQLRQRNIRLPATPGGVEDCRSWMQIGFDLYRHLKTVGYQIYPVDEVEKQYLEASPLASYTVWLERTPFRRGSLEGRLQRQLVLYKLGLDLPDPMRFFEEITRHRLLQGQLPESTLYRAPELEALAAAYVAWLAAVRPNEVELVGEREEGQIVIPLADESEG